MDLLADILEQSGLRRRFFNSRLTAHRAFRFPCDRSMGFHVVAEGEAFLFPGGRTRPIALKRGDAALMARGRDHVVGTERSVRRSEAVLLAPGPGAAADPAASRSGGTALTVISAAYQFWHEPIHPLFEDLPEFFLLRADDPDSPDRTAQAVRLLAEEMARPGLGSAIAVAGLVDLLFTYILRRAMGDGSGKPRTWFRGARDRHVGRALALIHSDCSRDWTLAGLAEGTGVSRSGLARKFRSTMNDTPFHYLKVARIQKAARMLLETPDKLEKVAAAVGYADAFAFSKAFKGVTGESPRDFRARDRRERNLEWRF